MMWKYAALITVALWSAPLIVRGQAEDIEVRRQVLATDDRRTDALRRGDVTPLRQIYEDDYTLVTPTGVIRSKLDQIDELASGRLRQEIEVTERTVRVYGDVAIVVSREKSPTPQATTSTDVTPTSELR